MCALSGLLVVLGPAPWPKNGVEAGPRAPRPAPCAQSVADAAVAARAPAVAQAAGAAKPTPFSPRLMAELRRLAPRFLRFASPHLLHVSPAEELADTDGTMQPR